MAYQLGTAATHEQEALQQQQSAIEDKEALKQTLQARLRGEQTRGALTQLAITMRSIASGIKASSLTEFRYNCLRASSANEALEGYKVAETALAEAEGRLEAMEEDRSTIKENLDRKHHFLIQTAMLRRFNVVIKDQKKSMLLQYLSAMRMNRFDELAEVSTASLRAQLEGKMKAAAVKVVHNVLIMLTKGEVGALLKAWTENTRTVQDLYTEEQLCTATLQASQLKETIAVQAKAAMQSQGVRQAGMSAERHQRCYVRNLLRVWYRSHWEGYMEDHIYAVESLAHTQITAMRAAENRQNLLHLVRSTEFKERLQGVGMQKMRLILAGMLRGASGQCIMAMRNNCLLDKSILTQVRLNNALDTQSKRVDKAKENANVMKQELQDEHDRVRGQHERDLESQKTQFDGRLKMEQERYQEHLDALEDAHRDEVEFHKNAIEQNKQEYADGVKRAEDRWEEKLSERDLAREAEYKLEFARLEESIAARLRLVCKREAEMEVEALVRELEQLKEIVHGSELEAKKVVSPRLVVVLLLYCDPPTAVLTNCSVVG